MEHKFRPAENVAMLTSICLMERTDDHVFYRTNMEYLKARGCLRAASFSLATPSSFIIRSLPTNSHRCERLFQCLIFLAI